VDERTTGEIGTPGPRLQDVAVEYVGGDPRPLLQIRGSRLGTKDAIGRTGHVEERAKNDGEDGG
jgi:hypothetical protein